MKIEYLNTPANNGLNYSDYLDFCEINGIEPQGEDSEGYFNYLEEEGRALTEDFFNDIEGSDICNRPCIVSGCLGLWFGKREIEPVRFDSLIAALNKCFGRDALGAKVELEGGEVTATQYHHDGTNIFTIKPVGGVWPEYLF